MFEMSSTLLTVSNKVVARNWRELSNTSLARSLIFIYSLLIRRLKHRILSTVVLGIMVFNIDVA